MRHNRTRELRFHIHTLTGGKNMHMLELAFGDRILQKKLLRGGRNMITELDLAMADVLLEIELEKRPKHMRKGWHWDRLLNRWVKEKAPVSFEDKPLGPTFAGIPGSFATQRMAVQ